MPASVKTSETSQPLAWQNARQASSCRSVEVSSPSFTIETRVYSAARAIGTTSGHTVQDRGTSVEFGFPLYPYLVDPGWVARFEERGHRIHDLVDAAIAADGAVLEGIPAGVTTALHICRGNYRSSWMCEGSLEPVAERVFGELPYDTFLVEWDDLGRDGGFEPVRFLRDDALMVMGIVSTKTPELETRDDLLRRMEEAAAFAGGMERLAISPQCGFASVMVGNEVDEDVQWRKLDLVGRVADRLWGRG